MQNTLQLRESLRHNPSVYVASEISEMLKVSLREAYQLLRITTDYKIIRFGRNVRADKASFDLWFNGLQSDAAMTNEVYVPEEVAAILKISIRSAQNLMEQQNNFRVLKFGSNIKRAHKASFDRWFSQGIGSS